MSRQCVERLDKVVGLLDRPLESFAVSFAAAWIAQRRLRRVSQPVERRFQIVSDIIGNFPETAHQAFDAIEHLVEVSGQRVEFAATSALRDAPRQVALHDGPASAGDGFDAVEDEAADGETAEQSDHREHSEAQQKRPPHRVRRMPADLRYHGR